MAEVHYGLVDGVLPLDEAHELVRSGERIEQTDYVVNGSFEQHSLDTGWALFNEIEGWRKLDEARIELQTQHLLGTASDGSTVVELDSDGNSTISQQVEGLFLDASYILSFDFSARPGVSVASNQIEIYWNGSLLDTISADGQGQSGFHWTTHYYRVEATGVTDTLTFRASGTDDTQGGIIDAVSLNGIAAVVDNGCGYDMQPDAYHANRDWLVGTAAKESFDGGEGYDWVDYRNSADAVDVDLHRERGTAGDARGDTIVNIENVLGSANGDRIDGDDERNRLLGEAGDDRLRGGDGNDVLDGGQGADRLDGGAGTADAVEYGDSSGGVTVSLETGRGTGGDAEGDRIKNAENIYGSQHDDVLTGDDAVNRLVGDDGDDVLSGLGGNDVFWGGLGADRMVGGNGNADAADYQFAYEGVVVSLVNGGSAGEATGDTFDGVENVYGSRFDDEIEGDGGVNRLVGGDGHDILRGMGGNDVLVGGFCADQLFGGDGIDAADYQGADEGVHASLSLGGQTGDAAGDSYDSVENLYGSAFADRLEGDGAKNRLVGNDGDDTLSGLGGNDVLVGGAGADALIGGDGVDAADYQSATQAVALSLLEGGTGGEALGDTFNGIENVYATGFDDDIVGNDANNRLVGYDGDDVLAGLGGNDVLVGGSGADTLVGGAGIDAADYQSASAGVDLILDRGGRGGDADGDTFDGIENIYGSHYDDRIHGDAAANRLVGNRGQDQLSGGAGDDILAGGSDDDWLQGGAGADIFLFERIFGDDVIADLEIGVSGGDRIQFQHMDLGGYDELSFKENRKGTTVEVGTYGTIFLEDIALSALEADLFIF